MNIYIKFDTSYTCKAVLRDLMKEANIPYHIAGLNEIELNEELTVEALVELKKNFASYGIEIIDDHKTTLIQKVKDTILEMVWNDEVNPAITTSAYLAEKLHHSYGYLSNLFSEITFTSIENFIIIQKIERAKSLLINEHLTLTEISYTLNYSSVAHLSAQFKKTTGLTPTSFQKIIKARRENRENA